MAQNIIVLFNVYELILLTAAIAGVFYDFCRTTVSTRFTSTNL